jgi:glyoxylase-like metal-dependent hydrolase (beta-lactamase superfamily II)
MITCVVAVAQRDFSDVEVKATKVAGSVYMLEGSGGNIGVSVGEDGVLMIDDQFAPLSEKIKQAIRDIGGSMPKFVLNTHYHGDHTGGNAEFGAEGTIIAHANVRARLANADPPKPAVALPVVTFDQSVSVFMNGEEVKLRHLAAGHTDGDAVVYFTKSNVVHMGDQLFQNAFPYVDMDAGGTVQGYIRNLESVLNWLPDDARVIPGHGSLSSKQDIRNSLGMIRETAAVVKEKMAQGKSLQDIQAEGLDDKWQSWGAGFINSDRWIETLYNSQKM